MAYKLYQITSNRCALKASKIDYRNEGFAKKGEVFLGKPKLVDSSVVKAKYGNNIFDWMYEEL